ncbi:VOC family protein [Pararhizobium sp. O133]|uniref:VOC family protein n=1 Tax=Pararhizobium sp. O133 TaxID=3449278 RepID=UPI003F68366F
MTVRRIVANLNAPDPKLARAFYGDVLGLDLAMDHGWIATFASGEQAAAQVSIASEGGSGTPVPQLSIEVDNVDEVYAKAQTMGFAIVYDITDEPWGVRRFYVRDPFGTIINILSHGAG